MISDTDNRDDMIDVRDVTERVEHLEALRQPGPVDLGSEEDNDASQDELFAKLARLESLLESLCGQGGEEQWRGDWYPALLVRDSYFERHAREEAESLCSDFSESRWPYSCIDWKKVACELQMDYSSIDFEGVTYWYRR